MQNKFRHFSQARSRLVRLEFYWNASGIKQARRFSARLYANEKSCCDFVAAAATEPVHAVQCAYIAMQ